jgi:HSP20 family molecular chaperone IbpA
MSDTIGATGRGALPVRPATDILEMDDGFHILLDMPGVRQDELTIDLSGNDLTVSGKSIYPLDGEERFLNVEFDDKEYVRTFILSDVVDRDSIRASLRNGVLDLFLPKVAESAPRRIEIQGA